MENPYKTYPGFGLRVHHAQRIILKLGRDRYAEYSERTLDNCFEYYDGSAVVFALMYEAKNGNEILLQGIRNMGGKLLEDCEKTYFLGLSQNRQTVLPL